MDIQEWEIYRHIEMEIIKEEIDMEISRELWSELWKKELGFELKLSTKNYILFNIILFSIIILVTIFYVIDARLLYEILELPHMKPIIMVTIPALFGLKSRRNIKKNQDSIGN